MQWYSASCEVISFVEGVNFDTFNKISAPSNSPRGEDTIRR